MKSLINIWDTSKNFWEMNPIFKTLEVFRDLYKEDKDKKKDNSKISKDLWFVACLMDFGSPYSDLDSDPTNDMGLQRLVSSNIMGDKLYWENNQIRLENLFRTYEMFCLTPAQRSLKAWFKKLQERDRVLADTEYVVGMTDAGGKLIGSNVAILDAMLVNTGKVWDQYFKIKETIDSEGNTTTAKGGTEESASDNGSI